jgi:hypothetical protein
MFGLCPSDHVDLTKCITESYDCPVPHQITLYSHAVAKECMFKNFAVSALFNKVNIVLATHLLILCLSKVSFE